ncbi:hypothetical protein OOZ51_00495 [Arthrobacter sp. MI7-26]|uniref:hypothetical protein n=1 Tax=Arthrobacter sp. MI7-26 TaxID=2993653 RepID=UPI002249862B|nr:hypothetical protein [Arthrobacter sp. MI7-26]MCX2746291.1 hypothetical protein [Arthrobacter sp. MI7-26]
MQKIRARPEVARVASPIPRRAKQISEEQSAQLAEDYRQGMKVGELAKKYVIHRVTVADHLAVRGISKRARGLTTEQIEEAIHRYQAGGSLAALGKSFKVSADTVRKALLRQGITMRRPWEHPLPRKS